jgi:hypothetical protein
MSTHDGFVEMLARRRELTRPERDTLDQHLAGCADCSRRADEYTLQTAALRTMPQVAAPPVLRARVLAATRDTQQPRSPFLRFMPALFASGATALLAAVVVFAWFHRPQGGTNTAFSLTVTARPQPTHVAKRPTSNTPATTKRKTLHHRTAQPRTSATHRPGTSTSITAAATASVPDSSGVAALGPPTPYQTAPIEPTVQPIPTLAPPSPLPTALAGSAVSHHTAIRHAQPTNTTAPAHIAALPAPNTATPSAPVAPVVSPPRPSPTAVVFAPTAVAFAPTAMAGIATPAPVPTSTPTVGFTPVFGAVSVTLTPTPTSTSVPSPYLPVVTPSP